MPTFNMSMKTVLILVASVLIIFILCGQFIAAYIAEDFKRELILHDYAVAGYLYRNVPDQTQIIAAFTAEKTDEDIRKGQQVLQITGYIESVNKRLIPEAQEVHNKYSLLFFIVSVVFSLAIFGIIIFHANRQQKKLQQADEILTDFLNGNTNIRLQDDEEGSLAKLFTTVNVMATSLTSHLERQKRDKEFLQNMISDISHQLKTPLAALMMYNEIIQEEKAGSTVITDFVMKSENQLKRIESLIQNMLKLAKMDAGMIEIQKDNHRVDVFLEKCIQGFKTRAEVENKSIILECDDSLILSCDEDWMLEAISNVIKNALDHTKAGDKIEILCEESPVITRLVIKDNGSGIHSEDIHHIFKRFYRSRYSKDKHGVGIGLSLTKAIIEKHGGTIWVESEAGKGTVFYLTFPRNLSKM